MLAWIPCNLAAAAVAYLCGAIPTGYWLGKALRGIDLREHGSGSTGATNVLRTLGKLPALATLTIDLLKGIAAVVFARWLLSLPMMTAVRPANVDFGMWLSWAIVVAALLAILGHSRSVFIRFTGGKSAATGLGVLLAIAWPVALGVAICFTGVLTLSLIVSLSSIAAAIAAVLLMQLLREPIAYSCMAIVGAVYVCLRHRANIRRLLAGTELRIGQTKPVSSA